MTTPLPAGPLTPYVVPGGGLLQSWPTGVDWNTIPPGRTVTAAERTAAQLNVCMAGTNAAEQHVQFPLRCMLNTETLTGPDYRVTMQGPMGMTRIILQRWPVTYVTSVQVCPNGVFPRQWTALPSQYWQIENPVVGLQGTSAPSAAGEGGQSVVIAPGYLNWWYGRRGYVVQVQYYHGWPHTSLTAAATAGATSVTVDDCTGWAPFTAGLNGALGVVYDITGGQETVICTAATATSGPGMLTLASPLLYAHTAGIMVSALPAQAIEGAAFFAAADALVRGANATVVQEQPGRGAMSARHVTLRETACQKFDVFRRTI